MYKFDYFICSSIGDGFNIYKDVAVTKNIYKSNLLLTLETSSNFFSNLVMASPDSCRMINTVVSLCKVLSRMGIGFHRQVKIYFSID